MHSCVHSSLCHTLQPAEWKVHCLIHESTTASITEEGRAHQFTASELQADLQPAGRVQGPGETRVGTAAAPPAQLCQLQPVPVCMQEKTFHRDGTTEVWSLHGI